jgi:UPF0176 protein
MFTVAALYRFAPLPDFRELREPLKQLCLDLMVRGTLLLAPEGINGTVAGTQDAIEKLLAALRGDEFLGSRLEGVELKFSTAAEMPFRRMKVRLKKEIVTLGAAGVDPAATTGANVDPADWNALIAAGDVMLIDVRNEFEVAMGTFAGATDPNLKHFSDFRAFAERELCSEKNRKIAMFCTGGIRCEKASAYLIEQGFENVYQLKGGILKYLEVVPPAESRWQGECFVFDERVALGHGLAETRDKRTAKG